MDQNLWTTLEVVVQQLKQQVSVFSGHGVGRYLVSLTEQYNLLICLCEKPRTLTLCSLFSIPLTTTVAIWVQL